MAHITAGPGPMLRPPADVGAAEAPVDVQEIQAAITHILASRRYVPGLPTARQHAETRTTAAELLPLTEARAGSERAAWSWSAFVVGLACLRGSRFDRRLPTTAKAAWGLTTAPLNSEVRG